ncbi:MAG: MFS transporter [Acidimicrobiia bacterium]|nr:MFS transporter [Acidimicrobiia bacterium]
MFAPTRLFYAIRNNADAGLLYAAAAVTVLFAATPFVIPAVADEFDVTVGRAGYLSSAQVGGFALAAFVAGRRFRADRRILVGASLAGVVFNLSSMLAPTFAVLVGLRVLTGISGGLLVWLAWADAMRDSSALRKVAAVGPLTALVAAPLLSWIADVGGADAVFGVIAISFVPSALLPATFSGSRKIRKRLSPSRSNVVLIIALGINTMAGSALFVFGAVIGESLGIDPVLVSVSYSLNALAGFIAARRSAANMMNGTWILGMALCAAGVAFGGPVLFVLGMTFWGFCFWMSTPPILHAIAAWSLAPDERVGDAQSAMAIGRAAGPAIGAMLVGDAVFTSVAIFTIVGLAVAATTVLGVGQYRRTHAPPVGVVGV